MPRRFLHRHQPPHPSCWGWIKAGLGGAVGIAGIGLLGDVTSMPLLLAPFGASSVLLFALPDSPLSQPANVIGGHLVAALLSIALAAVLPHTWWAAGMAVGLVIAVTAALRLTHPPAGADPLVVFLGAPAAEVFMGSVIVGSTFLVLTAVLLHSLPPKRTPYPLPAASG
ncbi:MAG: HPP family protein [Rhodospirillaceae bacterium]